MRESKRPQVQISGFWITRRMGVNGHDNFEMPLEQELNCLVGGIRN